MALLGPLFTDAKGKHPVRFWAANPEEDGRLVEVEFSMRNGRIEVRTVAPLPEVPVSVPSLGERQTPRMAPLNPNDFAPPDVA